MKLKSDNYKKSIIKWAEKHGRLPRRKSDEKVEKRYGYRLENYLSIKSLAFDPDFRELVYSKFPRKTNPKRDNDKKQRILDIMNFVLVNNRTPSIAVEEEKQLARTVANYTVPSSPLYSQRLVNRITKIDKCFKTGIQKKYRRSINEALVEAEAKLKAEQF